MRVKDRTGKAVIYLLLVLGAVLMLMPFYYMISTSLKGPEDIYVNRLVWIPSRLVWKNYVTAWRSEPYFGRYFVNSAFIATVTTLAQLATSALAAYAFSSFSFWGKETLFMLLLGTMMIPSQVTLVPNYAIIAKLGWIDTYAALIVPFAASVFGIFIMRQFFQTIPLELWDAAQIDGCGRFRYLWSVMVPLSRPVFITSGLFTFIGGWNSFLWPLIVTNTPKLRTIQVGLSQFNQEFGTKPDLLMAASTVAIAPLLVLFFVAQKHLIQGIAHTGLKS
ncbi:MAG: carbohydrate ABC transporter permease [Bacillota bacterium]